MIFVGDISLPFVGAVQVENVPPTLKQKFWFGNLEGAIINNSIEEQRECVVFNDKEALSELIESFTFKGFALANNHILDVGSLATTIKYLENKNLSYCGVGKSQLEANFPLLLEEGGQQIVILNFGWEVIQCQVVTNKREGVNPLIEKHVIKTFRRTKEEYPGKKIIIFFHWSYELEAHPQPRERKLAQNLIEEGAAGIIGCHPHRVGGFEIYKGRPIVYSLGNWMFLQNYYHNGKIKFPDFCNLELAFEWDFITDEFFFHFFNYNKTDATLVYSHSEGAESETMSKLTPFRGMSNEEYQIWYKKNRYHKWKGLPIYNVNDSNLMIKSKDLVNKLRDLLIYSLSCIR